MNSLPHFQKTEYLSKGFPAHYSYVTPSDFNHNMSVHWHKEWEIIRIVEGTANLQIDTQVHILNPGDFTLLTGGVIHTGASGNCIYERLTFDLHELFRTSEFIKNHLRPVYKMEILPYPLYTKSENSKLYAITEKLMSAASDYNPSAPDYNELIIIASLCELFAEILQNNYYKKNPDKNITNSQKIAQIKNTIEYIENNFQEQISLNDLACFAGMSPKYFCKVFKEVTHRTPIDYLILYRIEQACILLSTTNISIIDIAMECGFNDCSYFIRTFKKFKNKTPSQYRNN